MGKYLILLFFLIIPLTGMTNNGYVKLKNDSTIYGYLRFMKSIENDQPQIELWRSKRDEKPLILNVLELNEYAYKKDTFYILRNFFPFWDEDLFFERTLAELVVSGKVDLLKITDHSTITATTNTFGALIPALMDQGINAKGTIYILIDESGRKIRGIKKNKDEFSRSIQPFIEDNKELFERVKNNSLKYNDIEAIVHIYNSGI